ncbi:hypothetical protein B0H13DRAFT_1148147 [Mycena leptocephala]|nr:hypothetical protein B0H13DRAFT_1148147 [Mycena leptocephala]
MTMGLANILVCLTICALTLAQSDVVSPHSVSFVDPAPSTGPVSVNGLSSVARPTGPVSVNGLSSVPVPTGAPLTLSWGSTYIPASTSVVSASSKSNKGKIAGGVVGGLAVIIAAIGAFVFLRMRRNSPTHWRNRTTGAWQDSEGKFSHGPVYVGQPFDRPFDGYNHNVKPPTAAPLFIREPRIAHPFSTPERGHTRNSSSSHYRNDSMEMQGSPTSDATRF